MLSKIYTILKPFYSQTKRLQSRASNRTFKSIWETYLSCEYLLQHILTKKTEYAHDYDTSELGLNDEAIAESRKHIKIFIENY